MKLLVISIIARLLAFLGVLSFVFTIVYITNNTKFLWLLLLLLTVDLIPVYETKIVTDCKTRNNMKEREL